MLKKNKLPIDLTITNKDIEVFTKSKSLITNFTDIKSSKIGELYNVKPVHDNMHRLCLLKLQNKSFKHNKIPIPKKINKNICECLFDENKHLSIAELEHRVLNRIETPASKCITILDKYTESTNHHLKDSNKKSTSIANANTHKTNKHKKSNNTTTNKHKISNNTHTTTNTRTKQTTPNYLTKKHVFKHIPKRYPKHKKII